MGATDQGGVFSEVAAMSQKKYLWVLVSDDEYELPLIVADSSTELSRICGLSERSVASAVYNCEKNGYNCRYKRVEMEWSDYV